MSGFSPTPGPWFQNPEEKQEIMAEHDVFVIARVPFASSTLYSRHAPSNARLIAASPDAYELARWIVDNLNSDMTDLKFRLEVALRAAAYLAKVEGAGS